jgi:tRNA nucleotidyltransferase/poly(A) polymerase
MRALAGLRRRAPLPALREAASRRGLDAWIVGGAIRDVSLGIPPLEIDVAVSGEAEALARDLENAGLGRAVFLSRDRPGPRVYRVAGRRPVDIAEIEGGSIGADLARRDFTVNAVAVPLDGSAVLDPFGGLEDLARRRLRCVREENLREDPLRPLRAARFLATHGLTPDRATFQAARRAAHGLAGVAPERIASEMSRLLASPEAVPALSWAARADLLPGALGLALSPARAASLARSLAVLDDRATRRLPEHRRRQLRLAWLAHRLGFSEAETRRWLQQRRWARRETDAAARLTTLASTAGATRSRSDAWRWVVAAGSLGSDGAHLAARIGPAGRRRASRLSRLARAPRRRLAVTGADVMDWLSLPPGPAVGALLAELEVAAASGSVKNRREARHWLSGQVRKRLSPAIISSH